MKRSLKIFLCFGVMVLGARISRAALLVVNDGTTTTNLSRLANAQGTTSVSNPDLTPVETTLITSNGVLVASQGPFVTDLLLRTAWLARSTAPTNSAYSISADFRPEAPDFRRRGGVAALVNVVTRKALVFYVSPSLDDPGSNFLQTSIVDFSAAGESDNESLTNLFNLDGSGATEDITSALSGTDGYDPTLVANFQIQITTPTTADLAVVSNATAHILAKAFQASVGGSNQIGRTIELITDLPLPEPSAHRFGYFGYWGSTFVPGDVIGQFDNLAFDGGSIIPTNLPPSVVLTSPTNGASFSASTEIQLSAEAFDPEGALVRVDFFAGATLIGSATNSPFAILWTNSAAGTYELTARATDASGATGISTNQVSVTISSSPPPLVQITGPVDGSAFLAPAEIELDADAVPAPESPFSSIVKVDFFAGTNLLGSSFNGPDGPYSFIWSAVPAGTYTLVARATDDLGGVGVSTNNVVVTVTNAAPVGDVALTIGSADGNITISWPAEFVGIPLQSKTNLAALQWQDVPGSTLTNSVTVPTTEPSRFFRLSSGGASLTGLRRITLISSGASPH